MSPKENMHRPAPVVVATAHTVKGLREACALTRSTVGFVELRLDLLAKNRKALAEAVSRIRARILLTARHPAEGGARLDFSERQSLCSAFLLKASAIDVELRSAVRMGDLLDHARRRGMTRIISFHDFRRTPGLPRLREVVRESVRNGADVVKIAAYLRGGRDLAMLLLLQSTAKVPLATMGMGPLGKVSRLVLGAAGSRLSYGYLDKPQVPGQWPALELARRLEEVSP